ncbi:hypothetical protein C8Q80DRAFT_1117237 [Daedaleopsis nitida]|nr:hypothetical protein C8Q80DRAFT_1117237 [Daedaleopsis nitida]
MHRPPSIHHGPEACAAVPPLKSSSSQAKPPHPAPGQPTNFQHAPFVAHIASPILGQPSAARGRDRVGANPPSRAHVLDSDLASNFELSQTSKTLDICARRPPPEHYLPGRRLRAISAEQYDHTQEAVKKPSPQS